MLNREEAGRVLREAAGLASPFPGEVVQWGEEGFYLAPPDRYRVRRVDSDTDLALRDSVILADANGGGIALTLPPASRATWKSYTVKKIDVSGNTVSITPRAGETVEGVATLDISVSLETQSIISDGAEWWILG